MARCKLTNMNLRNIRKTREYQCLLIDLVKTGVVGKSAAEGLLGYTIPEGLLGDTTPVTSPDEDEEEPQPRMITVASEAGRGIWDSFEYDLSNGDTIDDVLAAANNHWSDGDYGAPFNTVKNLTPNQKGEISINDTTYTVGAPVESFEADMVVIVTHVQAADDTEE